MSDVDNHRTIQFMVGHEGVDVPLDKQERTALLKATSGILNEVRQRQYLPKCNRILGILATACAEVASIDEQYAATFSDTTLHDIVNDLPPIIVSR